jgi:hypothetical protein
VIHPQTVKIEELCRMVRTDKARQAQFRLLTKEFYDKEYEPPSRASDTGWNSLHHLLKHSYRLRQAFDAVVISPRFLPTSKHAIPVDNVQLSDDEWQRVKLMCDWLEVPAKATAEAGIIYSFP